MPATPRALVHLHWALSLLPATHAAAFAALAGAVRLVLGRWPAPVAYPDSSAVLLLDGVNVLLALLLAPTLLAWPFLGAILWGRRALPARRLGWRAVLFAGGLAALVLSWHARRDVFDWWLEFH